MGLELELEASPFTNRTRGQQLGTNDAAGDKVLDVEVPDAPDPRYQDHATRNSALSSFKSELDQYRHAMTEYSNSDSDAVLLTLSAHHARVCEIRAMLVRMAGVEAGKLRTQEVDPLLEAMSFQFKIHSRLIATYEAELRMTGGMT